jgi:hypothetical protein
MLHVGGAAPEAVRVEEATADALTAAFANAHRARDPVTAWSWGSQYAVIEKVRVHDAPKATGFVINSCRNTLRDCVVRNVGSTPRQHGFYVQGGENTFASCQAEGVGGFSYHNHVAVPALDASGNRYLGCLSVNPGAQHLVADAVASDGTNPDVPEGRFVNRYTEVIGCTFRRTAGASDLSTGVGVSLGAGGGLVSGCVFEDAAQGVYLALSPGRGVTNQTAVGNVFRQLNFPGQRAVGVVAGNHAVVTGNQFIDWEGGTMVRADGACLVSANQFSGSGGTCVSLNGSDATVCNNRAVLTGGDFTGLLAAGMSNVQVHGNQVILSGGASFGSWSPRAFLPRGTVYGNAVTGGGLRLEDVPEGLDVRDNSFPIYYRGDKTNALPLEPASGRLLRLRSSGEVLRGGLAVKLDPSGAARPLGTADRNFLGFVTGDVPTGQEGVFVAGSTPGSVVPRVPTDGAWKAGNVGTPSRTEAGKIHDSGSPQPPDSGSYVLFLDSGTDRGGARVIVLKTY